MSSAGGSPPVGKASVVIVPNLTGFQAQLQAQVNAAVAALKVPPITVPVTAAGGRGGAAAAAAGAAVPPAVVPPSVTKGLKGLALDSNAARGALIGLSHVTPVTVFGLQPIGVAALAAGLAITKAIKSTADFEHQLNVFRATTGATADEMKQVEAEAKQLGGDLTLPSTSAGDAARAMTELGKAGLSVKDTLAGARGVLQLAAAANLDVGTSATFVATELNAFNLAGTEATHVADLLAGASIAAQGEISDFGTAFQQVSAVAHAADVSLETTTGALTELAKAGLRGADSGTSLRTFLLRLTPTTKQAAEYQRALGIELDKNATIGEQLPKLINQYQKALTGLSPVLRQQALTQIFGQDAIRAATILINGGTEALNKNTAAANQNGAAAKLAEANAQGLSGAFNGLKSNADTLGITLGNFVKGPLTWFVTLMADQVGNIDAVIGALERLEAKAKSIHLPPIKIPFVGSVSIPGLNDKETKGGGGDFLKSIVTDLFALTPQGSSILLPPRAIKTISSIIKNARATVQSEIKAQRVKGLSFDELFPPFVPEKPIGGRNSSAEALGLSKGPFTPADLAAIARRAKALQAIQEQTVKQAKIKPPNNLLNAQIDAQIRGDQQAELAADRKIEAWLQGKKDRAIRNTAQYTAINQALLAAHQQTQSVLDQIQSEEIVIPKRLRIASLDAQLDDDLQRQLAVDRQIEAYLEKRLALARKQKKDVEGILKALEQAQSNTQSIVSQIDSENKKKQQQAADNLRTALGNKETQLSLAAQAAGGLGAKENALITFYKKESQDKSLTETERLSYLSKLRTEQKNFTATIAQAAKDEIDRRKALLDLAIKEAEATPGLDDNKRAINNEIRFLRVQRNKFKVFSKEWIEYQSEIDDLKERLKNTTDSSGPSLSDLFAEASKEFKDFASNVSTQITTPGGIRAQFAAAISIQNKNISLGEEQQIKEAVTTNSLLGQILAVVKRNPAAISAGNGVVNDPVGPASFATAAHARSFAGLATG